MHTNRLLRRYEPLSLCLGEDDREFNSGEPSDYFEAIGPEALARDDAIEQLYSEDGDRSRRSQDATSEDEGWMR
jgi:hypothetical protein